MVYKHLILYTTVAIFGIIITVGILATYYFASIVLGLLTSLVTGNDSFCNTHNLFGNCFLQGQLVYFVVLILFMISLGFYFLIRKWSFATLIAPSKCSKKTYKEENATGLTESSSGDFTDVEVV